MPRFVPAFLALLLAACTAPPEEGTPTAPVLAEGRIVDMATGMAIEPELLFERLLAVDHVLLGEKHDNAEHHRLQAEVVRRLQAEGEHPRTVAFEMMGTDQQLAIVEHLDDSDGDAAGLGEVLAWSDSGWPDWATNYEPIARAALEGGGQIVAANLPRSQIKSVYSDGSGALQPALVERSGLAERLPEVLAVDLRRDLVESHCGHAVGPMIDGMFRVQRARDAIMADRLVASSGRGGGVLIAGAQHVRTDRGVPWYIARLAPEAEVVSIAFVEADPPADGRVEPAPFDYLWYTGAVEGDGVDPCDAFRKASDPAPGDAADEPARAG